MNKLTIGGIVAIALAIAVALSVGRQDGDRPSARNLQALAVDDMAGLTVLETPEAAPDIGFQDADGKARRLADYRGQAVLVNLWATWCAPCVKEMPALDRLAQAFADADFALLPISLDVGGPEVVQAFYEKTKIANLPVLIDANGGSPAAFGAIGLPMTVLIDRDGRILARHPGDAEWDSPAAKAVIAALIERQP
ncbi:MAG: TlpA disulfide reductase family protein [Sphingomonadales bacterium]